MSIKDWAEKINPVRDGTRIPHSDNETGDKTFNQISKAHRVLTVISNGVKGFGIKIVSRDIYTALIIILVGLASFGLGRLSVEKNTRDSVRIETLKDLDRVGEVISKEVVPANPKNTPRESASVGAAADSGGKYVASRTGKKYHFPWCSGAQTINEANKIWFSTKEEAEKAGYTPASNCKGLK